MQFQTKNNFPAKMQEASCQTSSLDFYSTPLLGDERNPQLRIPTENGVPTTTYSPSQLCIRNQLPCTNPSLSNRLDDPSLSLLPGDKRDTIHSNASIQVEQMGDFDSFSAYPLITTDKEQSKTTSSSPTSSNSNLSLQYHSRTCENCGQELLNKEKKRKEKRRSSKEFQYEYNQYPSPVDFCRICHCERDNEIGHLIAPCKCKGTLKYVHQSCLQQWIKSSDCKHCELCGFHFAMNTKLKPIRKWEKLSMSSSERRKIMCSVMFHVIAITCVVWSLYVLIERTADELRSQNLLWPFWTKLVVVAIGFTGGLVFMYVQCKVYVQLWRRLKAFNRIIYVQHQPYTPGTHPETTEIQMQETSNSPSDGSSKQTESQPATSGACTSNLSGSNRTESHVTTTQQVVVEVLDTS